MLAEGILGDAGTPQEGACFPSALLHSWHPAVPREGIEAMPGGMQHLNPPARQCSVHVCLNMFQCNRICAWPSMRHVAFAVATSAAAWQAPPPAHLGRRRPLHTSTSCCHPHALQRWRRFWPRHRHCQELPSDRRQVTSRIGAAVMSAASTCVHHLRGWGGRSVHYCVAGLCSPSCRSPCPCGKQDIANSMQ